MILFGGINMKKFMVLALLLVSVGVFAQKENWKTFENKEMGIRFQYPPSKWKVFEQSKTLTLKKAPFIKDFAILKKAASFSHMLFHQIMLKSVDRFKERCNDFRDGVLKEKIGTRSRGIWDHSVSDSMVKKFNADEGRAIGFEYMDPRGNVTRGYIYYLRKEKNIYVVEIYYEVPKLTQEEKEQNKKKVNPDLKVLNAILQTIKLI
jgi:hypothetical protein